MTKQIRNTDGTRVICVGDMVMDALFFLVTRVLYASMILCCYAANVTLPCNIGQFFVLVFTSLHRLISLVKCH
jgi:hypothetical protein